MSYEKRTVPTEAQPLPADLPDPKAEQENGVPPGAIWVSDSVGEDGSPRRFRLKHLEVKPARWEEILPRKREDSPADPPAETPPAPPAETPEPTKEPAGKSR